MYVNLFSCVGAAIGSGGHNLVFSALKNGNQGQKTHVNNCYFLLEIAYLNLPRHES